MNAAPRSSLVRSVYGLALCLGLLVIWAGPHPPMVDLPQHAGQLRLLHDLLLGQSPWAELVEINLWTPYLIAFGLALPLSLILPIAVALQVVLSIAYLAFVYWSIRLRKAFAAPAELDWLLLFSFFGFAFKWGFLTFLVAAPIGLAFIALSLSYATAPSRRMMLQIVLLGALLLLSHALVFLYALAVGTLMVALKAGNLRRLALTSLPFVLLILVCAGYSIMRAAADARYGITPSVPAVNWHLGLRHEILFYPFGTGWTPWFAGSSLLCLAIPWLAGWRIDGRSPTKLVPLGTLLVLMLCMPSFAIEISMLYERFGLLLFPAYAWAFSKKASTKVRQASWHQPLAQSTLAATALAVLEANAYWAWGYRSEAKDFAALTASIKPGQRAMALVYDRRSTIDPTPNFSPNVHYASWYQAEQQGLVDMNFAIAPPQIVRFRPEKTPAVPLHLSWRPGSFDPIKHRAGDYRYYFVRGLSAPPPPPISGSSCAPLEIANKGEWRVFESVSCENQVTQEAS